MDDEKPRRSTRKSLDWKFPDECLICKKGRVQHKGEKVSPILIQEGLDYEIPIKKAMAEKDLSAYNEIKDLNLFERKCKMHKHCRRNFVRGFTACDEDRQRNDKENDDPIPEEYQNEEDEMNTSKSENFEEVCNYIDTKIIN